MRMKITRLLAGPALVGVAAAALIAGSAPVARAADATSPFVDEARTKIRKKDVRGAIAALEKAIAADAGDADANMLYQDIARDVVGAEAMLTSYRQKASAKPDDPLAAFLYARLLPPEDALKEFEKQAKQFTGSPWPRAGRARTLEALGRAAEAGPEYDAAIVAAPTEIRFKAYQAYGFERGGNAAAAGDAWRAVLASRPNDRAARIGIAESARKLGAYDDALATLAEVVKADPSDAEAQYRVGMTNFDAGKIDDALKAFDAALAADRTFVEAYCAAAAAALRKALDTAEAEKRDPQEKDFERSIGYASKAAAVGADRADAHFSLGAAHEAAGESAQMHYDSAAVEYDSGLTYLALPSPEKVRTLCAKAFVMLRLQKWDLALAAADKALSVDATCVAAYAHAGFALCAQGKQDEAIKNYYRKGLKVAPDDARLHHATGVALWEMAKEQEAKKELEAAHKAEPKNYRYSLTLGQLYYDLRMYRQAGELVSDIVDDRPKDVEVWRTYGRICCQLKDWKQAIEAYETICSLLEEPSSGAAAPPGNGGAPAGSAPAGGPPPGGAPAGGAPAADPAPGDEDLLIKAHLYLTIIYADHLKQRDKAKEHAKRYVQLGGNDENIQWLIDDLLADK
jgi:tetratricopeptide (TPR) repeat protein